MAGANDKTADAEDVEFSVGHAMAYSFAQTVHSTFPLPVVWLNDFQMTCSQKCQEVWQMAK